jgi:hypothetical protein
MPPPAAAVAAPEAGVTASADDGSGPCAVARVASYQAWNDALTRAKVSAGPAEAACGDLWNEKKKQACYHTAMAEIRATQTARDAVIGGGAAAREAVKGVKDDPKNDAIARARTASEAAFTTCGDPASP